MEYRVRYEIDIEATDPLQAARIAFGYMRDKNSMAPVLDVLPTSSARVSLDWKGCETIDLSQVEYPLLCDSCEGEPDDPYGGPYYLNAQFPGAVAHVENGKIVGKAERCDTCCRYETDDEAHAALEAHLAAQQQTT
jgi:hypothetical protein